MTSRGLRNRHDSLPPTLWLRIAGVLISAGLGLSGLAVGVATVMHAAWFAVAFEAMIALAGALGAGWSARHSRVDAALALLCVGGTIFVASVLAYLGAGRTLGSVSLTPLLTARLIACAGLGALAGAIHVADAPGAAMRRVGLGLILVGLPIGAIAALWFAPALRAQLTGVHPALATAASALAFVVVVGALSAGAHLLITAFAPSREPGEAAACDAPG